MDNTFEYGAGPVINIDVNSLDATNVPDWGRSTGTDPYGPGSAATDGDPLDMVNQFTQFADNDGPMVRLNKMISTAAYSTINGMLVRGGTLTTQGVWDDTDIVHVVEE